MKDIAGTEDFVNFRTLLNQLYEAHESELDASRRQFHLEINDLMEQNELLRDQLRKCNITPHDKLPDEHPFDAVGEDTFPCDYTTNGKVDQLVGECTEVLTVDTEVLTLEKDVEPMQIWCDLKSYWKKDAVLNASFGFYLQTTNDRKSVTYEGTTLPQDEAYPSTKWTVIFPNTTRRIAWDVVGLCLICYDLVAIPFYQAFDPPVSLFTTSMEWITLCFWTGDMMQGFFLGYFEDGVYEENNFKVLVHYLKSWFAVDCIVVVPDWIMKLLDDDGAGTWGELGKILKGARAIRVMRLLRLAKLQRIVLMVFDQIQSEYTFIVVNLLKMLLCVLVLNHLIACAWYGLARAVDLSGGRNWISVAGIMDESLPYRYLTALHWSLTQFTPAGMDISARNELERLFSIVVLFFAMIAFSSIVANITASMTSLRNMKGDQQKQFWVLRRYLRQRDIQKELSERIFKFLEHRFKSQSNQVHLKEVPIVASLSEQLRNELTYRIMSEALLQHGFFKHLDCDMQPVMYKLCSGLETKTYAETETVFTSGTLSTRVYFMGAGDLYYMPLVGESFPARGMECIAEATLWVDWRHQGELKAHLASELFELPFDVFRNIMQTHPRPWLLAISYAQNFHRFIHRDQARYMDFIRDENFGAECIDNIKKNFYSQVLEVKNSASFSY